MGEVDDGKACAALSYILIGLIWYAVDDKMKKNQFAKFHVKQGLVLLIVSVILNIAVNILAFGLIFMGIFFLLHWLVSLAILALVILGIINAVNGKKAELPVIGQYGKKFTF